MRHARIPVFGIEPAPDVARYLTARQLCRLRRRRTFRVRLPRSAGLAVIDGAIALLSSALLVVAVLAILVGVVPGLSA